MEMTTSAATTATPPTPSRGAVAVVDLGHHYDGHPALERIDLEVEAGEFVTLLGASGSGKSTLLHIVAGLIAPSRGRVFLDGRDITPLPPQQRDLGMVFQNYALFPHMTAATNVEFPLAARKVSSEQAAARVEEMLDLVRLASFGDRLPGQLSGGQQQRVAIARALAPIPRVLLLDEPLGALDKKLRQELGWELRRIQQETGVTTIYVTHDQEEALSLSDRIAVMDAGRIHQLGTPVQIYDSPVSEFVASFVGEVNVFYGDIVANDGGWLRVALEEADLSLRIPAQAGLAVGTRVGCAVRPERVVVDPDANVADGITELGEALVEDVVYLGGSRELQLRWRERAIYARVADKRMTGEPGQRVSVGWDPGDVALFISK